ncbi:MAG: helix-turn-helix transcriptional regulator [Clostridium sp.]|uniref:helix-turn-helix domain-containing protein n=1 Tax=Clostridium sp. TaxID=1506 RepID=UPI0025BBB936|nr:helix-turn-helix transcriptional regulator [Clostridium sp.]MCH3963007.1 helix-turn-helix transcriptional regulator [Clostridium sp.]MCI1800216.1 helix-turn-helix transcriptional regulator [Clostridium sp.]MCI2202086.1 helix-turn-helix transcriptional regulator [Clostridium sp.]
MEVKIARIRKGLTQKQLREKVNISPNKLVQIEHGNYSSVTFEQMKKIAKALGTDAVKLFFNNDSRKEN